MASAVPLKISNGVITNFQASDTLTFTGTLSGTVAVTVDGQPLSTTTIDTSGNIVKPGNLANNALNTLGVFNNGKTIKRFVLSQVSTAGSLQINPGVTGQKHKLIGCVFTVSADSTVAFSGSGASTGAYNLTGAMDCAKQGGFVLPCNPMCNYVETNPGDSFSFTSTGGGANGVINYLTEA